MELDARGSSRFLLDVVKSGQGLSRAKFLAEIIALWLHADLLIPRTLLGK